MTRHARLTRSDLTRGVCWTHTRSNVLKERISFKVYPNPFMVFVLTVLVLSGLAISMPATAMAPHVHMSAKRYAKAQLSKDRYKCISTLYGKESAWDASAVNGSHYGIPQGRSIYLATASAYKQVDWGMRYIAHRYGKVDGQPDTCNALRHWKKYKWH